MPNMRDWTTEQRKEFQAKSAATRRARAAARAGGRVSAADEVGEAAAAELEDGPELETHGGLKEPKPRRPPKAVKSALLSSMTAHAATIGAKALQVSTYRQLGPRGALTTQEAQGLVQPAGRLVTRRLALRIQLPGMSEPDAEDVGEMVLTLAEYILRLAAQAVDEWWQRVVSGENRAQQRERARQQLAAEAREQAAPPIPTAADMDPTAVAFTTGAEESFAPAPTEARNGHDATAMTQTPPERSQVRSFAFAAGLQPYLGGEE
jgi:hypothetical protein